MKISVVIPLYNKRNCIRETLRSVLNQSYTDFEVLVVDDASTDDSLEVVKEFSDKRLRIIEKPNSGVSATRNAGIAAARATVTAASTPRLAVTRSDWTRAGH